MPVIWFPCKPGNLNKFRVVIDFRHLKSYMVEKGCRYKTLKGFRNLARMGDFFSSVDLKE